MDNETAKIQAQELQHEVAKECVSLDPDSNARQSLSTMATEHFDQKISDDNRPLDHEKVQSEPNLTPIKVPKSGRRGLLGRFALIAEVTEPKHYSRATKYLITLIIALAGTAAPLGSAIIYRMFQA